MAKPDGELHTVDIVGLDSMKQLDVAKYPQWALGIRYVIWDQLDPLDHMRVIKTAVKRVKWNESDWIDPLFH